MTTRARRGPRQVRQRNRGILDLLEEIDPAAAERLTELRRYNPAAYKKVMRRLVRAGVSAPKHSDYVPLPINDTHERSEDADAAMLRSLAEQLQAARDSVEASRHARALLDALLADKAEQQASSEAAWAARQAASEEARQATPEAQAAAGMQATDLALGARAPVAEPAAEPVAEPVPAAEPAKGKRKKKG